jgi:hypothetical protein
VDATIEGDATSTTSAQYYGEHHVLSGSCPISRFGNRQAIRIIRTAHFPLQRRAQVAIERPAVHPSGIRVFDVFGNLRNGARDADPHGCRSGKLAFDLFDAISDGANRSVVIVSWRGDAVTVKLSTIAFKRYKFNFGSAEINPNPHLINVCLVHHIAGILQHKIVL